MDAATVEQWFTRADGSYLCARWGRPLSPVVFGVEDATLSLVKGAFEAVCALTGHKMAQTDPELGANVMVFFLRDWADLRTVPDLDRLIEGLDGMVTRLQDAGANQYRLFHLTRRVPSGRRSCSCAWMRRWTRWRPRIWRWRRWCR